MRRSTSHLAAAALALASLAPASSVAQQTDRDEAIGQALAGAALLGLFGLALREHRKDDDENEARAEKPDVERHGWTGPAFRHQEWVPPGQRRDWAPPGHRRDAAPPGHRWEPRTGALPRSCLRRQETARDTVRLFDGDCLERRYRGARNLPFECAILLDDHGRLVSGYVPRCLRAEGFEFADR